MEVIGNLIIINEYSLIIISSWIKEEEDEIS